MDEISGSYEQERIEPTGPRARTKGLLGYFCGQAKVPGARASHAKEINNQTAHQTASPNNNPTQLQAQSKHHTPLNH
ncbi:hypothetical protein VIM7927_00420 [Vibrio mangrovi]|nr:hypothetical protein VIM7927_00420 [Vibrio mangrovi]